MYHKLSLATNASQKLNDNKKTNCLPLGQLWPWSSDMLHSYFPMCIHFSASFCTFTGVCCCFQLTVSDTSLVFHDFPVSSKPLHYIFPHHLWPLTHSIFFWTCWVKLKWVRIWVLRGIWLKSWSSAVPGIGARQMELILLHNFQTRKMFGSASLQSLSSELQWAA